MVVVGVYGDDTILIRLNAITVNIQRKTRDAVTPPLLTLLHEEKHRHLASFRMIPGLLILPRPSSPVVESIIYVENLLIRLQ